VSRVSSCPGKSKKLIFILSSASFFFLSIVACVLTLLPGWCVRSFLEVLLRTLRPNNTFGFLAPDTTFACEDAQNLVCGAFSRANATHLCPPGIVVFQAFWHQIPRISGLFTAPSCLSAHSFLVPGGRDASRMVWVGPWSLHGCLGDHFDAPPATGSLNWYPPGCSGRCHGHRMQRAWEGCLSWEAFPLGLPFPHSLFTPPWPLFMHTGMLRMIIVMPKLLRT
jgi:hypothetical protein